MKKAIFFTIDSLLASGIIIVAVLLVANFYSAEQQTVNVNYASQDLVRVFSTMTVGEANNDYAKALILNGEITNANNTILEQIGDFWANDEIELAKNLTANLSEAIISSNYGFSILINGEEIYSRNLPVKKSLVSSRKIITGIAKAKPTEGFTSRALLTGIKSKKTNSYAYFGGYEGDGNLTKKLILPNDIIKFNSSYLEVDAGGDFNLYINGIFSGSYAQGSSGGGNMLADKWNISDAHLANFISGENTININFTSGNSYIAGGFLRITYITSSLNDTQMPGVETHRFPGIDGLVNLYSSFYVPNTPDIMNASLHFLSPYKMYLTIGNTTVFESNGSSSEQTFVLNNSNFSKLNYGLLSQKTVPIRMGLRELTGGKLADAVLITDRTSSMTICDVDTPCGTGSCTFCTDFRSVAAKKADDKFIDVILGTPGNKLGLVSFADYAAPVCEFHDFSDKLSLLKNRTFFYPTPFPSCGGNTCISCGVDAASQLLLEKEMLHGLDEKFNYSSAFMTITTKTSQIVNLSVDKSKFVKGRLSILTRSTLSDFLQQCVYLNGNYLGRICDSTQVEGWHTCSYPLKAEWLSDNGRNNATITAGNSLGCFDFSGFTSSLQVFSIALNVWESQIAPTLKYLNSSAELQLGDPPFPNMVASYLNISFEPSKARAAILEFNAIDLYEGLTDFYPWDCVYVNGNLIGKVDPQRWNGTNVWQKIRFDVPVAWVKNGVNEINVTSGTGDNFNFPDCRGTLVDNDEWRFRNLNLSIISADEPKNYDRTKSMLIMSDGDANNRIGGNYESSLSPRDETIQKACEAHNLYGIDIYAVAFGNAGQDAIYTLNKSACCDDCSNFYTSSNLTQLFNIYENIANSIVEIAFQAQTINTSGSGGLERTKLYPDSYLQFNYTALTETQFNRVPLAFETERFGNNASTGSLLVYPNTSISGARVTSYSGGSWTDNLVVNGNTVYRLSDYGNVYNILGDPFAVGIPLSSIHEGNNSIMISTGIGATNSTGGSPDNRIIYSLLLKGFSDYSEIVAKADGCIWTVNFEDGTSTAMKVPATYGGTDTCTFSPASYDNDDSIDRTVFELLGNLDIDKDGKVDVNIDQNNLDLNALTISKVPSLWGPAIIEIRVWE